MTGATHRRASPPSTPPARGNGVGVTEALAVAVAVAVALLAAACSNPITYSRIAAHANDASADLHRGAGGGAGAGSGGSIGTGDAGAGGRGADADADAGADGSMDLAGSGGTVGTGGMGTGGMGIGGMGIGGMGVGGMGVGGGPAIDVAQYNFEATTQGWTFFGPWTGIARLTTQRFAGGAALGATLTYAPVGTGAEMVQELSILPPAGTGPTAAGVVTFHVFLPANAAGVVPWVQPYVQDGASVFSGAYRPAAMLAFGGWTTIPLTLPATAAVPVSKVAVQLATSGPTAFSGIIYVDSIGW